MKVLVASTIVPFIEGGGSCIVDWLEAVLTRHGHEVEVLKLPFHSWYPEMLDQMLALRLLDVSDRGDRLIAIRTPSYLLRHPNKVLWFIHHHRGAYDLWGTPYGDIPDSIEGRRYREAIRNADTLAFSEAGKIFTNSREVSRRLREFNNVDSEVLYPPLLNPEQYGSRSYGDYIFYVSRITNHKRQLLAVESLRYTRTPVSLVIAGQSNSDEYLKEIVAYIAQHDLSNRVSIISEWISEQKKIDLLANGLASVYIPFDEDSYGYAALEAQHSRKAVITTHDSGGVLELISDGENGFITDPAPKAIARAMDRLYLDREQARRMGENGERRIASLGIAWDNVLNKLLS